VYNVRSIYTIGHSSHTTERFLELLRMHGITAIGDVRSSPYSQFNPQFNRETFQKELKGHNIEYVFLGKELGPRSEDPSCYENGRVQYARIAKTSLFEEGIQRVHEGSQHYRVSLMCAEKDPIGCHRMILVCRHLRSPDLEIHHILEDGTLEENSDAERRLMKALKIQELQLFESPEELREQAYDIQSEKIAYNIVNTQGDNIE
jgi:uncharacterized protein (DUF488 family)